jgi:hypothetical protein
MEIWKNGIVENWNGGIMGSAVYGIRKKKYK